MAQSWEFPPEAAALGHVRRLISQIAGIPKDHAAVLIASELAATAVKHARTRFEVAIAAEESIRIEVIDRAPVTSAMTNPSEYGYARHLGS